MSFPYTVLVQVPVNIVFNDNLIELPYFHSIPLFFSHFLLSLMKSFQYKPAMFSLCIFLKLLTWKKQGNLFSVIRTNLTYVHSIIVQLCGMLSVLTINLHARHADMCFRTGSYIWNLLYLCRTPIVWSWSVSFQFYLWILYSLQCTSKVNQSFVEYTCIM